MQIVWSKTLNYRAMDQWMREIPIVAERGKIVDRNGVILADNTTAYTVYLRSNAVKDPVQAAKTVATALSIDEAALLEKLRKEKASEITVKKHATKSEIERLCNERVDGLYYSRDNVRFYPRGETLCQVLGFTSYDNSGTTGIEKYYDQFLSGKNGEVLYETDLVGIDLDGAVASYLPAENGYNVRLTIDYGIQRATETALQKVAEQYSPSGVQAIVVDPSNFEVLAMAHYPSYDLNELPRDDMETLNALSRNRIVSDIYEPGSTFKIITSAANLEEFYSGNQAAYAPTRIFSSSRTRNVDGTTVKCWSNHAGGRHSNQTLAEALNNSCNPCFTDMALALGKETFYGYLSAFGFGRTSGLDFSGEALGMLLPETSVRACDLARIGFGQTIAVTPLQLALSTAAAVNGGYYYTPSLVKSVYADDGYVLTENEPKLKNRTVSEQTSRTLAKMLENVVVVGSGKRAYIQGYKIAGKTGTAQKYENGRIAAGKYVSSFVGFFPYDNPKYLALVTVDEPKGAYYGGVVAAPVAREIFEKIIALKNIQPYESE